jgi:3-oxoacyl-(acyl-carrier-protein) synthase
MKFSNCGIFFGFSLKAKQVKSVGIKTHLKTVSFSRNTSTYESRRVVVTGLGGVTPLGVNIPTAWQGILSGKCAIQKLEVNMPPEEEIYMSIYKSLPSKIAARIPLAELTQLMEKHFASPDSRVMSKAMMLGVLAAEEALQDAGKENLKSLDYTTVF